MVNVKYMYQCIQATVHRLVNPTYLNNIRPIYASCIIISKFVLKKLFKAKGAKMLNIAPYHTKSALSQVSNQTPLL